MIKNNPSKIGAKVVMYGNSSKNISSIMSGHSFAQKTSATNSILTGAPAAQVFFELEKKETELALSVISRAKTGTKVHDKYKDYLIFA